MFSDTWRLDINDLLIIKKRCLLVLSACQKQGACSSVLFDNITDFVSCFTQCLHLKKLTSCEYITFVSIQLYYIIPPHPNSDRGSCGNQENTRDVLTQVFSSTLGTSKSLACVCVCMYVCLCKTGRVLFLFWVFNVLKGAGVMNYNL